MCRCVFEHRCCVLCIVFYCTFTVHLSQSLGGTVVKIEQGTKPVMAANYTIFWPLVDTGYLLVKYSPYKPGQSPSGCQWQNDTPPGLTWEPRASSAEPAQDVSHSTHIHMTNCSMNASTHTNNPSIWSQPKHHGRRYLQYHYMTLHESKHLLNWAKIDEVAYIWHQSTSLVSALTPANSTRNVHVKGLTIMYFWRRMLRWLTSAESSSLP